MNGAAIIQDAIRANDAAEDWLEAERRRLREFEEEQERLALDPARSNHLNSAYRRASAQVPQGHARYYDLGEALQATRQARALQSRYVSSTIGPQDSDTNLHYSPEQMIWGK